MICILTTPIDLANYMEVYNIRNWHPTESVSHISWANLSKMTKDETLYLLAHGSSTKVEDMTPEQLAEKLIKQGLKTTIRKIKLIACGSGITGGSNWPYCQLLADKIFEKKKLAILVIGFDAEAAVTDDLGITYAFDKSKGNHSKFESDYRKNVESTLNHWDTKVETWTYGSEKEILDNVKKLQPHVQTAFEWLYKRNTEFTKTSIKGKTYGIPGQTF